MVPIRSPVVVQRNTASCTTDHTVAGASSRTSSLSLGRQICIRSRPGRDCSSAATSAAWPSRSALQNSRPATPAVASSSGASARGRSRRRFFSLLRSRFFSFFSRLRSRFSCLRCWSGEGDAELSEGADWRMCMNIPDEKFFFIGQF